MNVLTNEQFGIREGNNFGNAVFTLTNNI